MTTIQYGHHIELPLREIHEAVAREIARLKGLDPLDLVRRADLFFKDAQGKPVSLASVMVSWTE